MSEKRMIHSQLFEDDYMGSLGLMQRLLWIGIICACADDQGRLADIPAVIRSKVFPYDDIKLAEIAEAVKKFAADGKLRAYSASGRPLLQVVHWWRYQQPAWAEPSAYPAPEGWIDRIRWHARGGLLTQHWDQPGGFERPIGAPEPAPEQASTPESIEPEPVQDEALRSGVSRPLRSPLRRGVSRGIDKLSDSDSDRKDELSKDEQQKQNLTRAAPENDQAAPAMPAAAAREREIAYPITPKEAKRHPDIALFERVTGRHPGTRQYALIIDTIALLRAEQPDLGALELLLRNYADAWRGRMNERGQAYDVLNLAWLTEWALNGEIPEERKARPAAQEPDRLRYVKGQFADFVEH